MAAHRPEIDDRTLTELSALADGSLPAERVPELHARVAASPELAAELERQQLAVIALRELAATERAPHRLRRDVAVRREQARAGAGGWGRPARAIGLLAAAAAAVLAILLIPGSGVAGPSLAQAVALAARGPAAPPPASDPRAHWRLAQGVEEVYFPQWANTLGWRPSGQRSDRLGERRAITVYYRRGGASVAYTILAAPPLATPATPLFRAGSVAGHALMAGGRRVVTWRRRGLTCIISSRTATFAELQQLAGWSPRASIA